MIAIFFDIYGAYLLERFIKIMWLRWSLAFVVGILSPVIANLLMLLIYPNTDTIKFFESIFGGLILHPIVTLLALGHYQRKSYKKN